MFLSEKIGNEWLHPGSIEKNRRIVFWYEWSRFENRMLFASEEIEIFFSKIRTEDHRIEE
jgi:hypothetical protein